MLKHLLIPALAAVTGLAGAAGPASEKVILDTDFTTTGDDGMVGIMAAQLHAEGVIELLGITVVAGNEWLPQEVADALRAVERLGIASVGVYAGARYPLVHDYRNLQQEKALWGVGGSWYKRPEPADGNLIAPFDGFAATTRVQRAHAVAFIVDTVKKYPHDVTLLAIGPLTNIALAIRMNPEIVPLIKRIVYMGGAFEVPGNTTPSAEMNIWYDPEAARIVVREPIDQAFIPLDVTDTVPMNKALFERVTADPASATTKLLHQSGFGKASRRTRRPPRTSTTRSRWPIWSIRPTRPTSWSGGWTSTSTGGPATAARSGLPSGHRPTSCRRRRSSGVSTTSGSTSCLSI